MTAKKTAAPAIETVNGTVTIDVTARYQLTLARSIQSLGHVWRPSDRNIRVTGEALVTIAADAPEGAIIHAETI